ncbi:DUF1127 domain-containing protein [Pseudomonas xionganensis]|uniref:DUF1127 domain-containing protein n=1 Tax=Pseudomonas xionganensis TaxID=2654845 RepID=A0A6I4KQU1_9PSED|nr:DUF1127 domain-containing protein [Pseudomonas xionganensis]MVW74011.1 DUF1127 domain-containing protein [Pseudomonas xionganensis]
MERTLKQAECPPFPARASLWLRGIARLLDWRRNWRTRRQLASLDARLLADAGITEAQRQAELAKPFWR